MSTTDVVTSRSVVLDVEGSAEETKAPRADDGAGVGVGAGAGGATAGDRRGRRHGSAKKLMIVEEMPRNIRNTSKCVKFSYLVVYALLFWLLHSLPSTLLWNSDGTARGEYMFLLLFAATLSYISICIVQGTNPGYLAVEGEASGRTTAASVEMSSLLRDDGAEENHDGDSLDGSGDRKPIPISNDLIPERHRAASSASADRVPPVVRAGESKEDSKSALPLRSNYCRFCKHHVATFDHHCFMIGTCIGERNHCRFWWMLFTTTLCITVCIAVVDNGYVYRRYWLDWIGANKLAFGSLLFIGGLWIFHTWLACSSLTTHEMGKGPDKLPYLKGTKEYDLPFSKGIFTNLQSFCCMRDGMWGLLGRTWRPIRWKPPGYINRDSEDIFENCWENAYWSCC